MALCRAGIAHGIHKGAGRISDGVVSAVREGVGAIQRYREGDGCAAHGNIHLCLIHRTVIKNDGITGLVLSDDGSIVSIVDGLCGLAFIILHVLGELDGKHVLFLGRRTGLGGAGIRSEEACIGNLTHHTGGATGHGIHLVGGVGFKLFQLDGGGVGRSILHQAVGNGRVLVGIQARGIQGGRIVGIALINNVSIIIGGSGRGDGHFGRVIRNFGYGDIHRRGLYYLVHVGIVVRNGFLAGKCHKNGGPQ